jgi:hypothetical protein
MNYSFHPEARIELNHATDYYEECRRGLGLDFAKEIYTTINRIIHFPEAWSKLSKNTRRCLTNRFPFGVIYRVTNQEIFIIAVMHLSKKPNYWNKRQ